MSSGDSGLLGGEAVRQGYALSAVPLCTALQARFDLFFQLPNDELNHRAIPA
jgi:hypothetical protein